MKTKNTDVITNAQLRYEDLKERDEA